MMASDFRQHLTKLSPAEIDEACKRGAIEDLADHHLHCQWEREQADRNIHPLDLPGRHAARALLDDPSAYWRAAACSALTDGVQNNRTPDAILQAMLEAIAEYDRRREGGQS